MQNTQQYQIPAFLSYLPRRFCELLLPSGFLVFWSTIDDSQGASFTPRHGTGARYVSTKMNPQHLQVAVCFFSISFRLIIFTLVFSLHPVILITTFVSSSGPGLRLLSPLPTMVRAFRFYREKEDCTAVALSSPVDSPRIPPTHATKALSANGSFLFFQIKSKCHPSGIRYRAPMLLTVLAVAFEANH